MTRMREWICYWAVVAIAGNSIGVGAWQDNHQATDKPRKIKRVKRPVFTERDWDGVYFENLFRDGLVGERSAPVRPPQATNEPAQIPGETPAESTGQWAAIIDGTILEDEVKAIEQTLSADITTPGRFKSDYDRVHQSYSILSMLFAIIGNYDGDVRWKKYAPVAQPAFARAAANSRVGTIQAYNHAKRQKENLTEMVRGGAFNDTEKPVQDIDWPNAVGRSPIMVRLEAALKKLKPAVASKTEFSANLETVFHEANLVAAMGHVLVQPEMDEFDEQDYVQLARSMKESADQVVRGCRGNDYEMAAQGVNLIEQSCSNCHDEWR